MCVSPSSQQRPNMYTLMIEWVVWTVCALNGGATAVTPPSRDRQRWAAADTVYPGRHVHTDASSAHAQQTAPLFASRACKGSSGDRPRPVAESYPPSSAENSAVIIFSEGSDAMTNIRSEDSCCVIDAAAIICPAAEEALDLSANFRSESPAAVSFSEGRNAMTNSLLRRQQRVCRSSCFLLRGKQRDD